MAFVPRCTAGGPDAIPASRLYGCTASRLFYSYGRIACAFTPQLILPRFVAGVNYRLSGRQSG